MLRLCKSFHYKPKYANDADSIMLKHLASTVTVVLICLAAISFSAYAYFSHSVTSSTNTIKASSFSSSIAIKKSNGDTITEGKIQSYLFEPGKYIVTINADDSTTGTGYCVIQVAGTKYYTQQLGKDMNAPGQKRTQINFMLDVEADTTIEIESRWGTSSFYSTEGTNNEFYIKNSDPMQVITVAAAGGIADEESQEEESKLEESIPEETVPEETIPEETTVPTEPAVVTHTVLSGEYLSTIADKYGMHHTRLAAYNGILPPYDIHPGDVIKIPPEDWVEPTVPTEVTE